MPKYQGTRLRSDELLLRANDVIRSPDLACVQVYKALRGGVQDVAVKFLHRTSDEDLNRFVEVPCRAVPCRAVPCRARLILLCKHVVCSQQ